LLKLINFSKNKVSRSRSSAKHAERAAILVRLLVVSMKIYGVVTLNRAPPLAAWAPPTEAVLLT